MRLHLEELFELWENENAYNYILDILENNKEIQVARKKNEPVNLATYQILNKDLPFEEILIQLEATENQYWYKGSITLVKNGVKRLFPLINDWEVSSLENLLWNCWIEPKEPLIMKEN